MGYDVMQLFIGSEKDMGPHMIATRLVNTDLSTLISYMGKPKVVFEYMDQNSGLIEIVPADDFVGLRNACSYMSQKDREKAVGMLTYPRVQMEAFMEAKWTANKPNDFIGNNLNTETGLRQALHEIDNLRREMGEPVLFKVIYEYLVARAIVKFQWMEEEYRALGFFEGVSREELLKRLVSGWEDRPALYLLEKNIPYIPNGAAGAGLRKKLMADDSELTADEPKYYEGHVFQYGCDDDEFPEALRKRMTKPGEYTIEFDLNTPDGIDAAMGFISYGDLSISFYEYLVARAIVKFPWMEKELRKIWDFPEITREELAEWLKNGWDNRPEICTLESLRINDLCYFSGFEHVYLDYPDPGGKGRKRVSFADRENLFGVLSEYLGHDAYKNIVTKGEKAC